jgi:glutamate/tyrosine decarboxylase-like PLP-dependent enzyme
MTFQSDSYDRPLARAAEHARAWLDSVAERPVGPRATATELLAGFGGPLPLEPSPPEDVVDLLAALAEPGLMAMQSSRFFGWVIGGTLPAALGADWLVSAWDQNAGMRFATPAVVAAEEAAAAWVLDLLGLPAGADVGFVTGAMMANFTCLAAARGAVLSRVGWDVGHDGMTGSPRIHVLVGAERHETIDLALRYLGLGSPQSVAVDDQGRISVEALAESLEALDPGAPVIVCL